MKCMHRSLHNHTRVGRKATVNVKTLFIMNPHDLCKILTAL